MTTNTTFTHTATGAALALAVQGNNTIHDHLVAFDAEAFATYTANVPGKPYSVGYEVGRNADAPMTTVCGRTLHKAMQVLAESDSDLDRLVGAYLCKKCAKHATLNTAVTA